MKNTGSTQRTIPTIIVVAAALSLFTVYNLASAQAKSSTDAHQQSPSAEKTSAEQIFRHTSPAIFVVETLDEGGSVLATGSGVLVHHNRVLTEMTFQSFDDFDRFIDSTKSNLVVTNTHVIDGGVAIRVRQGEKIWPAEIEHINLHTDLCRLRVEGLDATGVELRPMDNIVVGEHAYAVGAPEGLDLTISEGLVSGLRNLDGQQVIQTSAAISHGSSGGGLFDGQGRLIGITTFSYSRGQNLNFALPTDSLLEPSGWRDSGLILRQKKHHTQQQDIAEAKDSLKRSFTEDASCAASMETIISANSDDWQAHYLLGSCLERWDPHRAVKELEKAIRLKPTEAKAHEKLGVALRDIGDPKDPPQNNLNKLSGSFMLQECQARGDFEIGCRV